MAHLSPYASDPDMVRRWNAAKAPQAIILPGGRREELVDRIYLHCLLDSEDILHCSIGAKALAYWGVPKILSHYDICVEDRDMEKTIETLMSSSIYSRYAPRRLASPAYMDFPHFRLKGVRFPIRLVPSSMYDLNIETDCVEARHEGYGITVKAPSHTRLIHGLIYAENNFGLEDGYADVQELLLFNFKNPLFSDSIINELSEEDSSVVDPFLKNRKMVYASKQGFSFGKWDNISDADLTRWRFLS